MSRRAKLVLCLGLLAFLAGPLAACNTVEGIGKDAQAAGGAISSAAEKTKGY
ncbi:MAG: entericidin A/B family lipoprotein [Alphaproteobacteria bacterium]|nr:entericidin A/B family lipoprotein [Alphaproteobacteria bacterium]